MIFYSRLVSIGFFTCLFMAIAILGHKKNVNINMCNWIKCENGGTCHNIVNSTIGFRCECPFSYSGLLCDERLNVTKCANNPCANNGDCITINERFIICICSRQFTGVRCETLI